MPDRELVLRVRCGHGLSFGPHPTELPTSPEACHSDCPGGSETVLDPERWLRLYCRLTEIRSILVKVQDVIDALGGSDE